MVTDMAKIDHGALRRLLAAEAGTDDVTLRCKEEIAAFLETRDFGALSRESARELAGIWKLSMGPAYQAMTGSWIPNPFVREEE